MIRKFWSTLMHYAFNIPFTLFLMLLGVVIKAIGLGFIIPPMISWWGKTVFAVMTKRITIHGKENIEKEHNTVVVLNHSSMYDMPGLMSLIPDVSFIGRSKLLKYPVLGWFLRIINFIPIDPSRMKESLKALRKGIETVDGGRTIVIFPEGTRTLDGKLNPFKRGFVHILRETKADLQPLTINGFYSLKSKYSKTINPKKPLSITVHPIISANEIEDMSDKELIQKTEQIIASAYQGE